MTVSELIAELQKLEPGRIVIMQADAEGNGYSPLRGVDSSTVYVADTSYSGDVWDESDPDAGESEPCVVLFPVN